MVLVSRCIRSLMVAVLLALGAFLPANAAGPPEKSIYLSGMVPACEWGTFTIALRFAQKEGRFWATGLRINEFEDVREIVGKPWYVGTIPRRFCRAVALINDGSRHAVYYWIGENTGPFGAVWGVEWCVVGLDHNWAFNPNCKMAQP